MHFGNTEKTIRAVNIHASAVDHADEHLETVLRGYTDQVYLRAYVAIDRAKPEGELAAARTL